MAALLSAFAADPVKKVTYEDDVLPIFRDNCLKCHNPDKLKGDLDLTSFSSAIKGGGSGATLNAGDPEGSQLYKAVTHSEDPTMPPNAKIPDKDIATIRAWIEGGLLQGVNSKALTANKPKVDLALKGSAAGKPEGPPPMPEHLSLEPVVHATHGSALAAIASSPWAPIVALAAPKQLVFYNTADLEFVGVLPFPEGLPCDVKFSRNGKLVLASGGRGGQSGAVAVWDITTGERVITVGDQFDSVLAADISADQQWIALGGPDRVLKIYATKDGTLEHRIKKHTEWVTAVEFSPDSKYLASGDRNGGVVLWEAETGQELFTLPGHKAGVTAISWRSDSELFVSASEDGTLKLWKASDGSALRSINAHNGGALCARFTHDGRIVSSGRDNKVQIWDATGKALRSLPFNGELPNRVTFNDDGSKVIGSDWKGSVYVWDAKSGKVLGELSATPPTLAERIERTQKELASLRAQAQTANATLVTREKEMQSARAAAERAQKAVSEARTRLSGAEARGDVTAERAKPLESELAALEKKAGEARKMALNSEHALATTRAAVSDFKTKLAAAENSLAKWIAAQRATPAAVRKVSLR